MTEKQETMEDRFEEKFTDTFWSEVLTEAHYGDVDTKPFLAFIRNEIQAAVEKAYQDGYEKGHEAACEFYRSERDILLKDKEKARIEVAEEIFNEFDTRLKKDHDVVDIYLLAGLKAKYLSPTQEKDTLLCGCPRLDRFSMCINQEHCKEKVQNKINTGSIDTEDKTMEEKIESELTKFAFSHISLRVCKENILTLFQETVEQAMPEKWKNVMGMSYRIGYNDALDEFRSKVLKDIGCDINVTSK